MWEPVTALLAGRSDVRPPDLPGQHAGRPVPFTIDGAVAAVRDVLPAEPVHLAGISVRWKRKRVRLTEAGRVGGA